MTIKSGTRLGPYEISDAIGAGGMGQVYRARDTRLDRTVAIKVLPPELASAPEFRERFGREARAIAALNHPHICTLHDVGQHDTIDYLVLEHLEGETLADRLARGPVPVEQTLHLGEQIADALGRAHRAGIVHRDLKPGNIMLTASGAKLLDFGLAKSGTSSPMSSPVAPSATLLPTTPPGLTMQGMFLGTSHYMSPEQVEGKEADARTDIFALGVVLYEMLTGKRPFTGTSLAHLFAAILEHEPEPVTAEVAMASPALVRTVSKCLAKNPDDRWQTASDLRDELRWIAQHGTQPIVAAHRAGPQPTARTAWMAWLAAAFLAIATIALAALMLLRPDVELPEYDAEMVLPASLTGAVSGRLALSPNGRFLAFAAPPSEQGETMLWVRDLASGDTRAIPGTEGATSPFWSPDSRTIGFGSRKSGNVMQVDAAGGPATFLYRPSTMRSDLSGGTWNRDNVIVFAPNGATSPIFRINANQPNADATALTELDPKTGETGHLYPMFLPDHRRFLYLAGDASGPRDVYVGSIDESTMRVHVLDDVVDVQYASGHLLFVRGTTLLAQPFDPETLTRSGQPRPLAERVLVGVPPNVGAAFSVSSAGELVYQTGTSSTASRLVWLDRTGTVTAVVGDTAQYADVMMSPDGRFASVSRADGDASSTRDDWIIDLATNRQRKLTVDPGDEFEAVWSFAGDKVLYNSKRRGVFDLYARSANGGGSEEEIFVDQTDKYPQSWSPDGEFVIYMTFGKQTGQDLWLLPIRTRKPEPLATTRSDEGGGQFSPDGRWIVYWARGHVWVMPFRRPGGPWQISNEAGGTYPRWTRGGREIVYTRENVVMSASVNCASDTCEVAGVQRMFERNYQGPGRWSYAVAPDGNRILALTSERQVSAGTVKLKVNWPARLAADAAASR